MKQHPYTVNRRALSTGSGTLAHLLRQVVRRVKSAALALYLRASAWLLLLRADSTQRYLDRCAPDGLLQSLNVRGFLADQNADIERAAELRRQADAARLFYKATGVPAPLNRVPRGTAMELGPALGLLALLTPWAVAVLAVLAWRA